jgi:hypothetical protein
MFRQWHRSFHKDVFEEHQVQGVDIVRNCGFVLLLGDYDVKEWTNVKITRQIYS